MQAQSTEQANAPAATEAANPLAFNYVLGVATSWNPTYTGSDSTGLKLDLCLSLPV